MEPTEELKASEVEQVPSQRERAIDEILTEIIERINGLRQKMRSDVRKTLHELPPIGGRFTGKAFVETVGTVVEFEDGGSDFFYTPHATAMRSRSLERLAAPRKQLFSALAEQVPAESRVLNIGAGGDLTPIETFRAAGHTIISTDMSEDTVQLLRNKGGSPAFACDLKYIDEVMPAHAVDIIIGNSTLAYVDPTIVKEVVRKLCAVMREGGIFTFDLTPHPKYFEVLEKDTPHRIVNDSAANPYKLLEYVKKYGIQKGIQAMAYHSHYQATSVNMTVIQMVKEEFEAQGMSCSTGKIALTDPDGMKSPCFTLRVSKNNPNLLQPVNGEQLYDDPKKEIQNDFGEGKPYLVMGSLDRTSGEILAREFGIKCGIKEAPWKVAHYIMRNQHDDALSEEEKQEVLDDIDPAKLAGMLSPFFEGESRVPKKNLPDHIAADQAFHKMVIQGEAPFGAEVADAYIDRAYEKYERQRRDMIEKERQRELSKKQKERRAKEKGNRKKGRK